MNVILPGILQWLAAWILANLCCSLFMRGAKNTLSLGNVGAAFVRMAFLL